MTRDRFNHLAVVVFQCACCFIAGATVIVTRDGYQAALSQQYDSGYKAGHAIGWAEARQVRNVAPLGLCQWAQLSGCISKGKQQ